MAKKLAYDDRKIAFEKQVKLAIAKEFSAGNKALPLDGGFRTTAVSSVKRTWLRFEKGSGRDRRHNGLRG